MNAWAGKSNSVAEKKRRQRERILAIGAALREAGIDRLDSQAEALGLGRSTAYFLMRAEYKASGLSRKVVRSMLASGLLPLIVRAAIDDYVEAKNAGEFGHRIKRRNEDHVEQAGD